MKVYTVLLSEITVFKCIIVRDANNKCIIVRDENNKCIIDRDSLKMYYC